jgi:hypothetical protein
MTDQTHTPDHPVEVVSDVLYCEVHPDRESNLRCNRCGRVMCTQCAVHTPVGYRCKECVREQQGVFYNAASFDYVIAAVVALVGGLLGAILVGGILGRFGFLALYISFVVSPAAGALIGDVVHRAVGKRRGRYTWLVVAGAIVLGALPVGLFFGSLGWLIYLVLAPGAAIGRLRFGSIRLGR